jgi:hypothetical protein
MGFRRNQIISLTVLGLFLIAFGAVLVWLGARAVRDRYATTTQTVSRAITLPIGESGQQATFEVTRTGTSAQVFGAGIVSVGLMFGVWALGCFAAAIRPMPRPQPGVLSRLSAVLLVASAVLLMPPWTLAERANTAVFWSSVIAWTIAGLTIARRPRWALRIGLPLFGATLLTEMFVPIESGGCAVLGVIATTVAYAHGLYLYPPWRAWAVARERADVDQLGL